MVETKPTERLANFQYAAPEQRSAGAKVTLAADIYALGLILNELFTRATPHGTDYRQIGAVAPELAFLDPTVAQMIKQSADERPTSIAAVKQLIQKYRADAVSQQKLSAIDKTVIKASEIDDPLAIEPPRLVDGLSL
jgi:serine/threonine protein kinase